MGLLYFGISFRTSYTSYLLCLLHNQEETTGFGFKGYEIPWKIRERSDWGDVRDIHRNSGTVQKDWARINSFSLNDVVSFSIRGHKGWDRNQEEIPYAFTVSFEAINQDIPV